MIGRAAHKGSSPFVVILVMIVLSLVGLVCMPRLKLQYTPTLMGQGITVSYSLADATAEVIEAEATSIIEGALSTISGVTVVSSVSRKGSGNVSATFRKGIDMDVARFEVASAIRNIWPSLPEGLTYPDIRYSSGGGKKTAISYTLKGSMSSMEIECFVRTYLLTPLASLEGVEDVIIGGATPWNWIITFDANQATALGIEAEDIAEAISSSYSNVVLGMVMTPQGQMAVRLKGPGSLDFGSIPVKRSGERVVYLRDLATWRYEESLPDTYFRVNGLNTITLSFVVSESSNLLSVTREIKELMASQQAVFPKELTASIAYDASAFIRQEIHRNLIRTGICVFILLLLVLLISRSWRYLCVIGVTLIVTLLTTIGFYALAGLQIHIYTLAGISVSLGIIIDASVVMADHCIHGRDSGKFPAIFVTTIAVIMALLMVLLLPESERINTTDFVWAIVINITIALGVSLFFIPSLMAFFVVRQKKPIVSLRRKKCLVRCGLIYQRYIEWEGRHRWILYTFIAVLFIVSFNQFKKVLNRSDFYRYPKKEQLLITAGLQEGCTVNQLNDIVHEMENYLAGFNEISVFTTSIQSYDNATIVVEFKPEYEKSVFPMQLKNNVTSMAINYGGANWSISGIDNDSFNNQIITSSKANGIILKGYNYQELLHYANILIAKLSANRRVQSPEIWGYGWRGEPSIEYNMGYDFEAINALGVNPFHYYSTLSSLLYDKKIGSVIKEGVPTELILQSSNLNQFDYWHVMHSPITVDSKKLTLSNVGYITKLRTGRDIRKTAQSYQIDVRYDFIGSRELLKTTVADAVDYMNKEILPVGYKAEAEQSGLFEKHKEQYAWLIILIVVAIFILLAMAFESFIYTIAIISAIPISFIGVFLLFGLSDYVFDQGGFASIVMLCGIAGTPGIRLFTAYRRNCWSETTRQTNRVRLYVKALYHGIVPVGFSIVSTALGLLPFLSEGPREAFWFSFASGTICGLVLSTVAVIFLMPIWIINGKARI